MDKIKNCTVCNMKLDVVNYLKHRTVCKTCYNKNRRKNNKNQKSKLLITITITFEPESSSDQILYFLEVIKSRIPKTPRKWNLEVLKLLKILEVKIIKWGFFVLKVEKI